MRRPRMPSLTYDYTVERNTVDANDAADDPHYDAECFVIVRREVHLSQAPRAQEGELLLEQVTGELAAS